jgi:hypothetical protein
VRFFSLGWSVANRFVGQGFVRPNFLGLGGLGSPSRGGRIERKRYNPRCEGVAEARPLKPRLAPGGPLALEGVRINTGAGVKLTL